MGQGALTNSIFSITTMAIAVPTGVKILTGYSPFGKEKLFLQHQCFTPCYLFLPLQ